MYSSVPHYQTLLDTVETVTGSKPTIHHGAIRVATEKEVGQVAQVLNIAGMKPVNYYDLQPSGLPFHATAFRPTDTTELDKNAFRLFVSCLRSDSFPEHLKELMSELIKEREILPEALKELVKCYQKQGGLTAAQSDVFVKEVTALLERTPQAAVCSETYDTLLKANPFFADVLGFNNPHLNHLTPGTNGKAIEETHQKMQALGIPLIPAIQGPPAREEVALLLRQSSYKAVPEPIIFTDGKKGTHTARFGEWETKQDVALTPKGMKLYNQALKSVTVPVTDPSYNQALKEAFRIIPDDLDTLRTEGLIYIQYAPTEKGLAHIGQCPNDFEQLIQQGYVTYTPVHYHDFLPVSAAGIFKSNTHMQTGILVPEHVQDQREKLEQGLGYKITDSDNLYQRLEAESKLSTARQLGVPIGYAEQYQLNRQRAAGLEK
jgi:uncharacterized glyoxalase superfamily metalloenzyme YdcJ